MRHKRAGVLLLLPILLLGALFTSTLGADSRSLPPYPRAKEQYASESDRNEKAKLLFQYARKENPNLIWNDCLAQKAFNRAKKMVQDHYFSHRDPKTGRNPAWTIVTACHKYSCAGENLSKGDESAEAIHNAFMNSTTHRKNILDPRFDVLGVACYKNICVELFAGF